MTTADTERLGALVEEARQIIARYPHPRSALLPLLHLVQSEYGFVPPDGVRFCAELLDLTPADVWSVVTFYSMFKRKPVGEYHVGVCTTTLCAILGGDAIYAALIAHLGVGPDDPTPDGKVSVERIQCTAACDHAPAVMVNWEFFDAMTPARTCALVDALRAGEPVHPTRGAGPVGTFTEAARVLAGLPEDAPAQSTEESPSKPTIAGLRMARRLGWTAPDPGASSVPSEGV